GTGNPLVLVLAVGATAWIACTVGAAASGFSAGAKKYAATPAIAIRVKPFANSPNHFLRMTKRPSHPTHPSEMPSFEGWLRRPQRDDESSGGAAVVPRTTSFTGRSSWRGGPRSKIICAARRPFSTIGCAIVVSGGAAVAASGTSS